LEIATLSDDILRRQMIVGADRLLLDEGVGGLPASRGRAGVGKRE
jgi:hypothetical protein